MSADLPDPEEGPDPVEPGEFDDLPSTDVEVEAHVHFGMAGSFPLRLAEVFFTDDGGAYLAEYSYVTPMFGLGLGQHKKEAEGMGRIYEVHGIDEVLLQADKVVWVSYDNLDRVRLDRGGRSGRPKITLYLEDGHSYAYRLHEGTDPVDLGADIRDCAERHDFEFAVESGMGFKLRENFRRFFTQ